MTHTNVTGVVLAAGFGTRLRPSTEICPKPLIPVAGVEPLFFALEKLKNLGVRNVIVNAHYLHEKIAMALKEWAPLFKGMEIRISVENPKILGTGGALLKIISENPELFKTQGLLLLNGDTLASFPLSRLVKNTNESTLAISYRSDHLKKYKPLWVNSLFHYSGIGPNPPTPDSRAAHFLGVHFLCHRDLQKLAARNFEITECDLFNGVYKPLGAEGVSFRGIEYFDGSTNDFWFDMTNTEFLLEAQRYILDSMEKNDFWPRVLQARYPGIQEIQPGIWVLSKNYGVSTRRYYSPAVMVESEASAHDREFGRFSLGPHASLIHNRGQLLSLNEQSSIEIKDSVVLVSTEKRAPLPAKIQGEVRVV